ncbi:MAG: LamG-like jellyroll fold domain-containing protein [Akkermansiaceae bacterium]
MSAQFSKTFCTAVVLCFLIVPSVVQAKGLEWKLSKSAVTDKKLKPVSGSAGVLANAADWDEVDALKFDGKQFVSLPEKDARGIPTEQFTVTARVRVDAPHRWGGVVTFSQDNGAYERGWILGFTNDRFSFKFSNGGAFQRLNASSAIPMGEWVTLTASYDGQVARLYQDGRQVGMSAAKGKVILPDIATPFVIGAYKDKDEFFGMKGAVESVKITPRALTAAEVRKLAGARPSLTFSVRPHLRFVSKDQAKVSWSNSTPGIATVAYGLSKKNLDQRATSSSDGNSHSVMLKNLQHGQKYYYRIGMTINGKRVMGRIHECDNALNYLPPLIAASVSPDATNERYLQNVLEQIKDQPAGYAMVLGVTNGDLTLALAKASKLNVFAIDSDPKRIDALRERAYRLGIYGRRITTMLVQDNLPVTGCMANLIISERALAGEPLPVSETEALRLLRPTGGVIAMPNNASAKKWAAASLKPSGDLLVHRRKKLPGSADWSHQYGTAGNATYTGEEMGGAKVVSDLRLQWLGRPGADFNIDRQPRTSAPLSVNGRVFHQGMNRIIALDAFNGAVLWSMEVPDFRRLNVPHDSANWCADEEHLYMVVEENAWVVSAVTGEVVKYLQIPTKMRESHNWGFIANEGDILIGSSVKMGAQFKDFWGSARWFDQVGKSHAITQVCSDKIFGYNKGSWKGGWAYGKGVIINSTISLKDGKLYFLENRDPKWTKAPTGRISDNALWMDLWAVCLDAKTGKKRWDEKIPAFEHMNAKRGFIQSAYGMVSEQGYLTVFSESVLTDGKFKGGGQFVYHLFSNSMGRKLWSQKTGWRHNHHGAHISHPVVRESTVFTDPYTVDLKTGKVLAERLAHRKKCPTPVAWKNGLMFRGTAPESGSITLVMWDKEKNSLSGWNRLRPNCWLNSLPTQGGLIMPEGGGGCSCGGWMETSVGFLPVRNNESSSK